MFRLDTILVAARHTHIPSISVYPVQGLTYYVNRCPVLVAFW